MKLSEKLERFRKGGAVRRYHTHILINPPNVAEHQYNVTVIAHQIYQKAFSGGDGSLRLKLLFIGALYHDQAEYETGDVPGWVKRRHPELKEVLTTMEGVIEQSLGIGGETMPQVRALIKVADDLDHIWTCIDERSLGNQRLDEMFFGAVARIKTRIKEASAKSYGWDGVARDLLDDMVVMYDSYDRSGDNR